MSDKIKSFLVCLESDTSEETAETLRSALCCIKGVISVEANVVDGNDFVAQSRAKFLLGNKLWEVLYPKS